MSRRPTSRRFSVSVPGADTPAGAWLRGIRLPGFAVSMLFLLVAAIIVLAPSLRLLIEQQQDLAALREAVAKQQAEVEHLEEELARWDDPAYLEAQARSRLYYVYPGEISYLVIDDGQTPVTADGLPISDEIQTTEVDWLRMLTTSIFTAATTIAPPAELAPPTQGAP
ncbi:FtsB family cell division protein [Ruicaihuangia caeni]|uniref:Septum formation initiator family protein n=1 Tax=Ruicaihuangia caeni TaxID=3042517 RepID=A0AAW6T6R5_9MICO|nr:septum formation initiator family protein [Klugiella sp. YN-L-19]MDI2099515.1 septum formation initiator family protein [Klugiella sp. YN-L-19]